MSFGTWFLRRETKQFYFNVLVTAIGGLVGTATLFLLYEQNKLITDQNQKITLQTDANITQSVLLEGTRRASLSGDMSNLFNELRAAPNNEDVKERGCINFRAANCWEYDSDGNQWRFRLAEDLLTRVQTFAQRNTPYQIAESSAGDLEFDTPLRDQFAFFNLSPERGQLFETFAHAKIKLELVDFSAADLRRTSLIRMNLREAYLLNANLFGSTLWWSDFTGGFLSGANFVEAGASETQFGGAELKRINATDADFPLAYFRYADLSGANFTRADLSKANFRNATLNNTRFENAHLSGADFSDVDFSNFVSFEGAWAWRNQPPIGLPEFVKIDLCDPIEDPQIRPRKPLDCGEREWDN